MINCNSKNTDLLLTFFWICTVKNTEICCVHGNWTGHATIQTHFPPQKEDGQYKTAPECFSLSLYITIMLMFFLLRAEDFPVRMLQVSYSPNQPASHSACLPVTQTAILSNTQPTRRYVSQSSSCPAVLGWQRSDLKPSSGILFLPRWLFL